MPGKTAGLLMDPMADVLRGDVPNDDHRRRAREPSPAAARVSRLKLLQKRLEAARGALARERLLTAELKARADATPAPINEPPAIRVKRPSRASLLRKRLDQVTETLHRVREEHSATARKLDEARLDAQHAALVRLIAQGQSFEAAVVRYTETGTDAKERKVARALAHSLAAHEGTASLGRICIALHALKDGIEDHAWALFQQVSSEMLWRLVPVHWAGCWLKADPDAAAADLQRRLEDDFGVMTPTHWWGVAKRAGGLQAFGLLRRIIEALTARRDALASLDEADAQALEWARIALAGRDAPNPAKTQRGAISIGILDYKMLDLERASSNAGDYVQTLAMLSNLLRFQAIRYDESDLGRYLEAMKPRIAPERRIGDVEATVRPVIVDRDFSSGRTYPCPTWTIAFGWYMHPNFRKFFDFPFADGILPIFVSFHVNNRAMLGDDAVAYLARHAPIGCRDWTTVYLLRERGIPAFFSGCLTTTIGQLFAGPPAPHATDGDIALVDYRPEPGEFDDRRPVKFTHADPDIRAADIVQGLQAADDLLQRYRTYGVVATSRLHCYLPSTALGLDVRFRPGRRSDIRFEGLIDLEADAFATMRRGIEDKVETILRTILAGAAPEDVHAHWRRICAADVAAADDYCARFRPLPAPSFDVAAITADLRAKASTFNDRAPEPGEIDIAMALDRNLLGEIAVVIESITTHTSRPLGISILCRGIEAADLEDLARDYPRVRFRVFGFDTVTYANSLRLPPGVTVSTIDRLLLPNILSDVSRLVYLDIDIVVLGDVGELFDMDLRGFALAGKSSNYPVWMYGHSMVYSAAGALPAEKAWDLRRRMHAAGDLRFRSFNAGVLVLDLDRMRRDDFAQQAIPLVEDYAMNDQDALNVYARRDREELGVEWNAVPNQDAIEGAKIVHFAGSIKPWDGLYVSGQDLHGAYRAQWQARRAARMAAG